MKSASYLTPEAATQRRTRSKAAYYVGHVLVYVGLLVVCLVLAWLSFKAIRIYSAYQSTMGHVQTLQRSAAGNSNLEAVTVEDDVRGIAANLETINREAQPFLPLAPYLGWVPVYGADIQAAPTLLAVGRDLSRAGVILVEALSVAQNDASQGNVLSGLVAALGPALDELRQLQTRLEQQQVGLAAIDTQTLSPTAGPYVEQLNTYFPQINDGLELIINLPGLLGAESPQTYLLLAPNADELRPAGGYITAAGHITFDRGEIIEFIMQDSYAADNLSDAYPYPPGPLYDYMASEYWVLRDAGWSPDFPTVARQAVDLYALGQGIEADGVISFDQHALALLLRGLGPVEVEGDTVTGQNVITLMRQRWAPDVEQGQSLNAEWWQQRKSFMVTLGETVINRLQNDLPVAQVPGLLQAVIQASQEKHLLLYFNDLSEQSPSLAQNLAGALPPVEGDYLMVVDANLGFNKANAAIARTVTYGLELARDGGAKATVRLDYQHQAQKQSADCSPETRYDPTYDQNIQRCYWNYLRLVVPATAELIEGPSEVVAAQYLLRGEASSSAIDTEPLGTDKMSWGQLFLLRPEESKTVTYHYQLPPDTAQFNGDTRHYRLYLQKQPGTVTPEASVTVTLPPDSQLVTSEPEPVQQQGQTLIYDLSLTTDRTLEISYR